MSRQVPTPSAAAWLIDLSQVGGPAFVVLRVEESEARRALGDHLVEIGIYADPTEARHLIQGAATSSIGVIW